MSTDEIVGDQQVLGEKDAPERNTGLEKELAREGVFKGFNGLEGLAEAQAFWDQQPYGTRLYYGGGGTDYLHRDVLRAAIRALKSKGTPSDSSRVSSDAPRVKPETSASAGQEKRPSCCEKMAFAMRHGIVRENHGPRFGSDVLPAPLDEKLTACPWCGTRIQKTAAGQEEGEWTYKSSNLKVDGCPVFRIFKGSYEIASVVVEVNARSICAAHNASLREKEEQIELWKNFGKQRTRVEQSACDRFTT